LTEAINLTPSFFTYQVRGLLPIAIQLRDCQLTIRSVPQSLDLAWPPRVDDDFLTDDPQKLVQQGQVAKIPIVSGDCDDEGTLFSLAQTNVT
jgi:carboxylesterase type B